MFKALAGLRTVLSGCGDWIDAPVSRQLTLTGTSYGTPMDLVPSGVLPEQQVSRSRNGEGEVLGWAVRSAGPQQGWTHWHQWTAGGAGRPRAYQRLPGEGKTAGQRGHHAVTCILAASQETFIYFWSIDLARDRTMLRPIMWSSQLYVRVCVCVCLGCVRWC